MRSDLFLLLRTHYLNSSGINACRYEKDKKKKRRALGLYLAYFIVAVALVGYSFTIAAVYGYFGMTELIPSFAVAVTSIICLFFTMVKTNGFLFAYKDYDMLMSLPISVRTIISARFFYMYLENLLFTMGVMLPMGLCFLFFAKGTWLTAIFWFVMTLFAPLLPMAIAALIGTLISAIGSGFQHKVLVQTFFTVVFVTVVMIGSFALRKIGDEQQLVKGMGELGTLIQEKMNQLYPPAALFEKALLHRSILAFCLFLLVSLGVFFLFLLITEKKYREINTALTTHQSHSNYKLKSMKTRSMMGTLLIKEWKRFTSSVLYMTNIGIGLIFGVLLGIACPFLNIEEMLTQMTGMSIPMEALQYVAPLLTGFMINMTCSPAVSLSLEGKNFWILQSLPMDKRTFLNSKILFNMILVLPVAFFCNICLILTFHPSLLTAALYFLISVTTAALTSVFDMLMGMIFKNMDWTNEVEVLKQGAAAVFGVLGNMLFGAAMVAVMLLAGIFGQSNFMLLAISMGCMVLTAGIYALVMKKKL